MSNAAKPASQAYNEMYDVSYYFNPLRPRSHWNGHYMFLLN